MLVYSLDCIVTASVRAKSKWKLFEFRLIDRFQYLLEDTLHDFVLKWRNPEAALAFGAPRTRYWRLARSYQTGFPPVLYSAPNWRTPPVVFIIPCLFMVQIILKVSLMFFRSRLTLEFLFFISDWHLVHFALPEHRIFIPITVIKHVQRTMI